MKWTIPKLRKEVWKLLVHSKTTIALNRLKKSSAASYAHTGKDFDGVEIYIDHWGVDVKGAVVHEILHWILDPNLKTFLTYHVYELLITELEKAFFKGMPKKEKDKFRRAVEKKLRKSHRLKTVKVDSSVLRKQM